MKTALITGITGQDGSYLAELLISKGYKVHGLRRRTSHHTSSRIDHIYRDPHDEEAKLFLHYADLTDSSSLWNLIERVEPEEIYNLAAQSHVGVSFECPEYTADVNALGTLRLLEAARKLRGSDCKFYQASTSELFGNISSKTSLNEESIFNPCSPYSISKLYAYWITKNYREAYNMYACNGILFNHESPRRGETFVTRKITIAIARIVNGLQDCLYLGNLDAIRDWGHAKDYVEMQWLMLQQNHPKDYVISTGECMSVRDFTQLVASYAGITLAWEGEGLNEVGIDTKAGRKLVKVDPIYYRPCEVNYLLGDSTRAKKDLNWSPKYRIKDLAREMIDHDLSSFRKTHE